MKNLTLPTLNSNNVYTDIKDNSRNEDKKARLERLEGYVFSRYQQYEDKVFVLEEISSSDISDEEDKKALESCYNRNPKGYLEGKVVAQIISVQSAQLKNKCPYWELINLELSTTTYLKVSSQSFQFIHLIFCLVVDIVIVKRMIGG